MNVLVMCTCTHVHDKLLCTRLQNYTIMYTNMAAETKLNLLLKIIKLLHQPVNQRDILVT